MHRAEKMTLPSETSSGPCLFLPPESHLLRSSLSLELRGLLAPELSFLWPLVLSQVAALDEVKIGGSRIVGASLQKKTKALRS